MGKEARTRNDSRMIRCCRSEKKESCTFRMTHYVLVTNIFLTFGFALSLLSSMDCFFLKVDVGFKPVNAVYDTSMFGIGLWTFEDPNNLGYCSSNIRKANISDMSFTYSLYSRNWSNGDSAWTGSRIMCSIGTSFGIVALVLSWICSCTKRWRTRQLSRIIVFNTAVALAGEGIKFGLFFNSKPCVANAWELIDVDEVSTFHKAATCLLNRGSYLSICSMIFYTIVIIYLLLALRYPNEDDKESEEDFSVDGVTSLDGVGKKFSCLHRLLLARTSILSVFSNASSDGATQSRSDRNQSQDSDRLKESKGNEKRDIENIPLVISSKKRRDEEKPQRMEPFMEPIHEENNKGPNYYRTSSGLSGMITGEDASEVFSINSQSIAVSSIGASTMNSSIIGGSKKSTDDTTVGGSISSSFRGSISSTDRRKQRIKKSLKEMDKITFSTGSISGLESMKSGKKGKRRDSRFKFSKEMSHVSVSGFSYVSGFSSLGVGSTRSGQNKSLIPPREDEGADEFYA